MFKMDLSKFQKTHSDKNSTTLQHKDGHSITIAHKPLSAKMREQLDSLATVKPKKQKTLSMDEGGDVQKPKDDSNQASTPATDQAQDSMRKAFKFEGGGQVKSVDDDTEKDGSPKDPAKKEEWNRINDQNMHNINPNDQGPAIPIVKYAEGTTDQPVPTSEELQNDITNLNAPPQEEVGPPIPTQQEQENDSQIAAKEDMLKSLQPGYYNANPQAAQDVRSQAEDSVLRDKQVAQNDAQFDQDVAKLDYQKALKDTLQHNEQAAQYGLPQRPLPPPPPGIALASNQMPAPQSLPTGTVESPQGESQAVSANTSSPVGSDSSTTTKFPSLMQGYQERVQGLEQEANAATMLANQQAGALKQEIHDRQGVQDRFQEEYDRNNAERQNFIKDVQSNMINPDKYWENHSRLAAGLGVILAGFNPTNKPNAAIEFLNNEINRSIQSQSANLSARNNLLSANLHHFQNIRDAANFSRVQLTDLASNKLALAAAQTTDPMVKAKLLQQKGQLDSEAAMQFMKFNLVRAINNPQNSKGIDAILPQLRVVDPAMAKEIESRYIPTVGLAGVPVPEKTRDEIIGRQSLQEQVHNLRTWAQAHSGDLNQADRAYGEALSNSVQDAYRRANGQGVFREAEAAFVKGIVSDNPTAFLNKYRVDPKYRALEDSNRMALNGIKRAYSLPESSAIQELSPQQQSWVKWAQANPKDPRSQAVLTKLGVK